MKTPPIKESISVVLVGQLNPTIFQPAWFSFHGILGEQDISEAMIEIIHPDVTIFRLNWLKIHVQRDRFIAEVTQSPTVRVHDLVVKVFKEFLSHTPIFQLGINRNSHFKIDSKEKWCKLGDILAPKEPWGDWGKKILGEKERNGGLLTIVMEQRPRDDGQNGYIRTKIEPSPEIPYGIYIQVNDHYEVKNPRDLTSGSTEIISILEASFNKSLERANWIMDSILRLV